MLRTALVALFVVSGLAAEDITTLDGRTYANAVVTKYVPEGLVIQVNGKPQGIKYGNLPGEVRFRHRCEAAMQSAKALTVTLKKTDAFSLSQIEDAKKKAAAEGKPLGFIMVWDQYFNVPAKPANGGGSDATAHFWHVFKDQVVLVFVSHESELPKVPDAVKSGFNGPDEGGFAPNMAVVDAAAEKFICEIPMGGGADSDNPKREAAFRAGIAKIVAAKDLWLKPDAEPAADDGKKPKKKKAGY